jgi:hypothetical protein
VLLLIAAISVFGCSSQQETRTGESTTTTEPAIFPCTRIARSRVPSSSRRAAQSSRSRKLVGYDHNLEGVEIELSVDLARFNQSRKSVKRKSPFQDRKSNRTAVS